jgi:hypothetical protein
MGRGHDGAFLEARRFGIDASSARLELRWNDGQEPFAFTDSEALEIERLSFHPAWSLLGDTEWMRPAGRSGNLDWLYPIDGPGLPGTAVERVRVDLSGIGLMGSARLRLGGGGEAVLE